MNPLKNGFGNAATILGLVALALAPVPFLNYLGIFLTLVALGYSSVSILRTDHNTVRGIVGASLAIVSIILSSFFVSHYQEKVSAVVNGVSGLADLGVSLMTPVTEPSNSIEPPEEWTNEPTETLPEDNNSLDGVEEPVMPTKASVDPNEDSEGVVYEATSTGKGIAITGNEATYNEEGFTETWTMTENTNEVDYYTMGVDAVASDSGEETLSCKITVNGEVVAEETGTVSVSCDSLLGSVE